MLLKSAINSCLMTIIKDIKTLNSSNTLLKRATPKPRETETNVTCADPGIFTWRGGVRGGRVQAELKEIKFWQRFFFHFCNLFILLFISPYQDFKDNYNVLWFQSGGGGRGPIFPGGPNCSKGVQLLITMDMYRTFDFQGGSRPPYPPRDTRMHKM